MGSLGRSLGHPSTDEVWDIHQLGSLGHPLTQLMGMKSGTSINPVEVWEEVWEVEVWDIHQQKSGMMTLAMKSGTSINEVWDIHQPSGSLGGSLGHPSTGVKSGGSLGGSLGHPSTGGEVWDIHQQKSGMMTLTMKSGTSINEVWDGEVWDIHQPS